MPNLVYINTTPEDTGSQTHPWVSWSDTQIELDTISKQGLPGNTFYYKVEASDGSSSPWYGPVLVGELYNELINILSSSSISSAASTASSTIVNAILNIGQLLGTSITGQELGTALLNISQNVNLDVDTQAVLNAAIFLLQSETITPADFGSVVNAILSLNNEQTIDISQYEPPAVHKVKFIRLKLKP